MKFAVITDVHGNARALEAVLADIDAAGDVERIYCLGDMIAIGHETNEVLGILFGRDDVSMITGNHDEAVLALAAGRDYPRSHLHVLAHHQWIADNLAPAFIDKLEELPRIIREEFSGHRVLFTHYHIEERKVEAPISEDPFSQIVEPGLGNAEKMFSGHGESLICFGHHHPQHFFHNDRTIYLNPGALGCNHKPEAPYAIVEAKAEGFEVEIKQAVYDNKAFLEAYETLQVPERDFILRIFHGGQMDASFKRR
ncbi:metallophosphoesterase family protein [Planococcus sp. CAU13]|uniref:metallophosphoesterase family protein n=1 Tax=Planococcus sp. CAU13 TaxID=1541197 RepID=UPI00052FF373|nr:metallophosphoesterase family protein [Planococcus sp. CAU13]